MSYYDRMQEALKTARRQLVTLGGEAEGPDADMIQRAVLRVIDEALEDYPGIPSPSGILDED